MSNQNESNLTIPYVKVGDYCFPNLSLPPDAGGIGFWGRRRREFLREYRPITFNQLVLSGELFKYLVLFNQEATERLESLIQGMKVAQGITEELKGRDQTAWVGAMNNIRACAEEIVYNCSTYSRTRSRETKVCCNHYISTKAIRTLLLDAIRTICQRAVADPEAFARQMRAEAQIQHDAAAKALKKKLARDRKRCTELDRHCGYAARKYAIRTCSAALLSSHSRV